MAEGNSTTYDCGICKDVLRASATPKLLACHHSFCLNCLKSCVRFSSSENILKCPTCRLTTTLQEGGLQKLQTNFYISETPKDDNMCDACGHNLKLNRRCLDCQQNFCDMCASTHIKMASSREHTLADISDKPVEDEIDKAKTRHFCKIHETDELKMFCKKCSEVICIICKFTKHDGHTSTDIATEAAMRRKTIHSLIEKSKIKLQSTIKNTKATDRDTQANHLKLLGRADALENEKNKIVRRVNKEFDDRIMSIKHHLGAYKEETRKAVKGGEDTSETFNRIVENSRKSLEEESDLDIIIQFDNLSKDVKKIQDVKCKETNDKLILEMFDESNNWLKLIGGIQSLMPTFPADDATSGNMSSFLRGSAKNIEKIRSLASSNETRGHLAYNASVNQAHVFLPRPQSDESTCFQQ